MHAVRQAVRPKHQVLILKCYPKFQKNAVDVKPNPSELSYLLYYVNTRRSKVQKVGTFLEKRTASDVWRGRLSNVQVTLQILKALIDKSPRDLPLYAASFLRVIGIILRSKDLTMVEETLAAFDAFCLHHDGTSLAADQDHIKQYEEITRLYADFAVDPATQVKGPVSAPVALRWRSVGLSAVKSIASSDALGFDGARQLSIIMPVILLNLCSDNEDHLQMLHQRAHFQDQTDVEKSSRRRTSINTVQTTDTSDNHPLTASVTTADADKLAEEDLGIVALQCLKQIFVTNSKGQIRIATSSALHFIVHRTPTQTSSVDRLSSDKATRWATTLIEMIAQWSPVQDRYIILVTAMENLVRSPVVEDNLEQQLVLTTLIGCLLSSSVNLIGLSVMDVLLGLIQHILQLLQLDGVGGAAQPHHQQTHAVGTEKSSKAGSRHPSPQPAPSPQSEPPEIVSTPSPLRRELLQRLQRCIGDLATHIYYSDQISDMIAEILLRLKPSPLSAVGNAAAAVEDPAATAKAISDSVNLQEAPGVDHFFSFDTARVTALKAVKEVLLVANVNRSAPGAGVVGRNRVGVHVWEGTQWLLRDHDGRVRKAYVDALLTWLTLEVSEADLRLLQDRKPASSKVPRAGKDDLSGENIAKRAVSGSSNREKAKPRRTTFLQLLHLAIYENAVAYANSESDILLLHLLLTNLVEKLGVNAVRSGLPMILRLQEDIPMAPGVTAKVRLGSLVHGYFWTLSEIFNFETSAVGKKIQTEISRRRSISAWADNIRVPPVPLDVIDCPPNDPIPNEPDTQDPGDKGLRTFDDRPLMVDRIASGYALSLESPPVSPPSSPGRRFSVSFNASANTRPVHSMPAEIKEQMLADWSRESAIADCEKDTSRSASLNGSKNGTTTSAGRNLLAVTGATAANGSPVGSRSASRNHHQHHHHHLFHHHGNSNSRPPSIVQGLGTGGALAAVYKARRSSGREASPSAISSSSRGSTVRVDDLKRVLSGQVSANSPGVGRTRHDTLSADTSSDSMVSADVSQSEFSYAGREGTGADDTVSTVVKKNRGSATEESANEKTIEEGAAWSYADADTVGIAQSTDDVDEGSGDEIPPVPPLPATLSIPGGYPATPSDLVPDYERQAVPAPEEQREEPQPYPSQARTRSVKSGRARSRSSRNLRNGDDFRGKDDEGLELDRLLGDIDVGSSAGGITVGEGLGRPPY